jgi:hypothetical protein
MNFTITNHRSLSRHLFDYAAAVGTMVVAKEHNIFTGLVHFNAATDERKKKNAGRAIFNDVKCGIFIFVCPFWERQREKNEELGESKRNEFLSGLVSMIS